MKCATSLLVTALLAVTSHVQSAMPPRSTYTNRVVRSYTGKETLQKWSLHIPGGRSAREDERFQQLSPASASGAENLDENGRLLGKCLDGQMTHREIVDFLISRNVARTNIHAGSNVRLVEEGEDITGYWGRFIASQCYYTQCKNVCTFDFAIHIAGDGTMRLMHVNHVGPTDEGTPKD